jgi:hypothetical protein
MIVELTIPASTQRKIERDERLAGRAADAIADGLETAAVVGAEEIRVFLVMGESGLTMQHPGTGMAAAVMGWMLDRSAPLAAMCIPGNSPAAAYAGIQERGGTIVPRTARALAVPISEEAKMYSSPRDMPGLTMIPRQGRPPLLVRQLAGRGDARGFELHWVLVPSVTIAATHWLTRGAERARPEMAAGMQDRMNEYAREW